MRSIFGAILSYYFRAGQFFPEIQNTGERLVHATLIVYKRIQEELKPTPLKSHY